MQVSVLLLACGNHADLFYLTELPYHAPPHRPSRCTPSLPLHGNAAQDTAAHKDGGSATAVSDRQATRGDRREHKIKTPRAERLDPDPRRRGATTPKHGNGPASEEVLTRAGRTGKLGGWRRISAGDCKQEPRTGCGRRWRKTGRSTSREHLALSTATPTGSHKDAAEYDGSEDIKRNGEETKRSRKGWWRVYGDGSQPE